METITFPLGYQLGITPSERQKHWPQLSLDDFHFTSKQNPFYNCMTWAVASETVPHEDVTDLDGVFWLDMWYFQDAFNLDTDTLDHSAEGYANILISYYSFQICETTEWEEGFEKVVLYEDKNGDWAHIARQLDNGQWTSKMGMLEDLQHYSLETLNGKLYGTPKITMKRKIAV